ncbi:lysozyme inhibitor LprI family protein [Runella limosa]|uniref:lysozyme inhibitor LprI family protein n=1 Tax=Runella limosa TaxID=370978 RepID=UPI0004129B2D|nr:lysozyme inhibitor LprI family protein [Runella limosa]
MKKLLLLIATFSGLIVYGQTQSEINKHISVESRKKDLELTYIIEKIKIDYDGDVLFLKSLEESQKAWVTYKNSMIKAKFPNINQPNYYGSSLGLCVSDYLIFLTDNRIKELKVWLDGLPEGDICNGSVKNKNVSPVTSANKRIDGSPLFKKSSDSGITLVDSIAPKGSIDANSKYGKTGGVKAALALNVSGWGMGARPQINDDSGESGRVVFEITVDDTGDIVNIMVKETTFSQSVVENYRREVKRMKLVPKSENVPRLSKGTITFNVQSK